MRTTAGEIDAGRRRRNAYDEGADEPAKLIEMESVEVEAEVPPRKTSRSKR